MVVAETFKALGDPVRLQMLDRLSSGDTYTLSTVSQNLGITRQGARKHLQVLAQAHLVTIQTTGRSTTVTLAPETLKAANSFIADLERKWDFRLQALREYAESIQK